jgi:hypothetical protein
MSADWLITATPPEIDIDVIKTHCRIPVGYVDDDQAIKDYIAAAVAQVERITERTLGQGTAVHYGKLHCVEIDGFVYDALCITALPLLPDQTEDAVLDPLRDGIISVEYLDTDSAWQEIDSANWQLYRPGHEPATLLVTPGFAPDIHSTSPTPYRVTVRVGYAALPPGALQAIKLWTGECYRCREVMTYGQTSTVFKQAFDAKCRSLQWRFKG